MARWSAHLFMIGAAYVIAGRIGQYFAAPPIYATAVWPAAGIALAGLLILGSRVWPGLFLGALIVNSWSAFLAAGSPIEVGQALLAAAGISIGVTLQAMVAVWLVRCSIGYPNNLSRERDILVFLALGGPLACTIGATIGVGSLLAAGSYPPSQVALNWWTWWVGDVIGVIIFAPLTLILFAKPKQVWQARRPTVAVPLAITLAAVTLAFAFSHVAERRQNRLKFERRVGFAFDDLKENINRTLELVQSMQAFYAGSVEVSHDEFEVFHRHLLTRHEGVQALEWIPSVPHKLRGHYEAMARDSGFAQFQFTERSVDNSMVVAADREEYFPVFHVVPHQGNEAALGFDLGSNVARREALIEARDTGQQVATAPITLVQETEQQAGFLVLMPVYANNRATDSPEARRENLRGFVLAVFRVGDIVTATLPPASNTEFNLTIVDSEAGVGYRQLYSSGGDAPQHKTAEPIAALAREIRWRTTLPLAGRRWTFEFSPSSEFFATEADNDTWIVLAGGLLFTSLLGVFLMIVSGRATQVEELVVERTEELTDANRDLEREITSRKRFEEALSQAQEDLERRVEQRTADLKESESRYQDLYNNAPDMFVSVDVATQRLTECNGTFLAVTGFEKQEMVGRPVLEIYHADSLETARNSFQSFLKTGLVKDVELNLLRKNQEPLAVSLNVSAVRDQRGQLIYSRSVLRDINEKKVAETKIKQREAELAHVARLSTMGEMAAGRKRPPSPLNFFPSCQQF